MTVDEAQDWYMDNVLFWPDRAFSQMPKPVRFVGGLIGLLMGLIVLAPIHLVVMLVLSFWAVWDIS